MNNAKVDYSFIIFIFFISACRFGTGFGEKIYTPEEFRNVVNVDPDIYTKDSINFITHFKNLLEDKKEAFYSKAYFDSTEVFIDTILYSDTSLKKLATFVIVKNLTSRQIVPKKNEKWYYDAFCYIGIRSDSGGVNLKWLRNFYPMNWYSRSEISSLIRDMYFTEFAALKDTSGNPLYGYNLDDKKFWSSRVWDKYFGEQ